VGKVLDFIAITFSIASMIVVLLTLIMCLPDGKWSVNANGCGEMYFEVALLSICVPISIWRLLRRVRA
jgi:hypothetical protein